MLKRKNKFFLILGFFIFFPIFVNAFSAEERVKFFVEPGYDKEERKSVQGGLQAITDYSYLYVDVDWWEDLSTEKKEDYREILLSLGEEFKEKIYPKVTENFSGIPQNETVGEDEKIVVLFHPMESNSGGYFRTGDQLSMYRYSRSNEGNILYINADFIKDKNLPGYLSHEFVHLVTFNEKGAKFGVSEEVWLNELRAELVITMLGYDENYKGSNLEIRVENFLRDPDVSLTEWTEQGADYGVVNVFGQYLLDHYGEDVFYNSLQTEITGIPSIDYALEKENVGKTFADIFTDWTVAVYLNDCSYGDHYCFKNENLKDLKVSPSTIFLSAGEKESAVVEYKTKNWAGNWHQITGEEGTIYLKFQSEERFSVPYVLCKEEKNCIVEHISLREDGKGEVVIEDFGSLYDSLTLIPSLQDKFHGFNGSEEAVYYQWSAEIIEEEVLGESREKEETYKEIRERLLLLQEKVEEAYFLAEKKGLISSPLKKIEKDLYYGMRRSEDVKNLQRFLKKQGEDIYPEGLITGNFFQLTKKAVIRFQEKYKKEVLLPLNLTRGTGYVGSYTRDVINSLLENKDA